MGANTVKYKIAHNIKALRKAHGETGEELGSAIGVKKTAISNYEVGYSTPSLQAIIAIAEHYDVSVGRLLHSFIDVADCAKAELTYESCVETAEQMFPLFDVQKDVQDEDFSHGRKIQQSLMSQLKRDNYIYGFGAKADSIIQAYSRSIENNGCPEAAANMLSLIFLLWACTNKASVSRTITMASRGEVTLPDGIAALLKNTDLSERRDEEFCKEFDPSILETIKFLKTNIEWGAVGDYYFALRFVTGLIDSDIDRNSLCEIGIEMLVSYAAMGNERAYDLLLKIDSFNSASQ